MTALRSRLDILLASLGVVGLVAATAADPSVARAAAAQVWPPFVLVTGLLLIGLVADDDGVFSAAGQQLARRAPSGIIRVVTGQEQPRRAVEVLGLPVLVGLFGVAVSLGTLGRVWSGPAQLFAHLSGWGTAILAAFWSVLVNNLPAASLLAAHRPPHPYSLLIGLNLGPNLFITGSLAWLLWLRAARSAGAHPSPAVASHLGIIAVPLSMAAALGALSLTGAR